MTESRTVVTVEIAGDEYTIRADATPDYTRECARYVNRTLEQIMARGSLIEAHKSAILAAMALADQLFQARAEVESLRDELARKSARLLEEIESSSPESGLASSD